MNYLKHLIKYYYKYLLFIINKRKYDNTIKAMVGLIQIGDIIPILLMTNGSKYITYDYKIEDIESIKDFNNYDTTKFIFNNNDGKLYLVNFSEKSSLYSLKFV